VFGRLVYKYRNMGSLRFCAVTRQMQNVKQGIEFAEPLDLMIWNVARKRGVELGWTLDRDKRGGGKGTWRAE
jgi:hypothetical protein